MATCCTAIPNTWSRDGVQSGITYTSPTEMAAMPSTSTISSAFNEHLKCPQVTPKTHAPKRGMQVKHRSCERAIAYFASKKKEKEVKEKAKAERLAYKT